LVDYAGWIFPPLKKHQEALRSACVKD